MAFSNIARARCRRLPNTPSRRKRPRTARSPPTTSSCAVRTELHYHVNRPHDRLTRNLQRRWPMRSLHRPAPSRRIEPFMRDVYKHLRGHLPHHAHARTAPGPGAAAAEPAFSARLAAEDPRPGRARTGGRVEIRDGEITARPPHFSRSTRRLMRVFLHANNAVRVASRSRATWSALAPAVTASFSTTPTWRRTFLSILNQRGNVAPVLRAMTEVDLLGKLRAEIRQADLPGAARVLSSIHPRTNTPFGLPRKLDRVWEAADPVVQT